MATKHQEKEETNQSHWWFAKEKLEILFKIHYLEAVRSMYMHKKKRMNKNMQCFYAALAL